MCSPHKPPTLTGTLSSTQMTQPTGTSSTTPMLPSLPLETPTPSRLPVFLLVLIVAKPTLSSTHMTPTTRAEGCCPSIQPVQQQQQSVQQQCLYHTGSC